MHAKFIDHASTPTTQARKAHWSREHVKHAITSSKRVCQARKACKTRTGANTAFIRLKVLSVNHKIRKITIQDSFAV